MIRTPLLALAVLAFLAALPVAAAPAPAAPPAGAALNHTAPAASCVTLTAVLALPGAAAAPRAAVPAWLAGLRADDPSDFHGFCHCGCSQEPDCNTDDDCSGGHCNEYRSCC